MTSVSIPYTAYRGICNEQNSDTFLPKVKLTSIQFSVYHTFRSSNFSRNKNPSIFLRLCRNWLDIDTSNVI
jgi:hypothetical protein